MKNRFFEFRFPVSNSALFSSTFRISDSKTFSLMSFLFSMVLADSKIWLINVPQLIHDQIWQYLFLKPKSPWITFNALFSSDFSQLNSHFTGNSIIE
jgi:hypothetical protein